MKYAFEKKDADKTERCFTWSLVGSDGGVHIWAQFMPEKSLILGERLYGGVEVHYRKKPYDHMPDNPIHEKCWLLNGPCWHDGSSLYFSEKLQPLIDDYFDDPERLTETMNAELLSWYKSHLNQRPEESV